MHTPRSGAGFGILLDATKGVQIVKLSAIAPPPQKISQKISKEIVKQRRMIGVGLREAPHIGEISKHEPKRWSSQLHVAPGFFMAIYVEILRPQTSHFSWGRGGGNRRKCQIRLQILGEGQMRRDEFKTTVFRSISGRP